MKRDKLDKRDKLVIFCSNKTLKLKLHANQKSAFRQIKLKDAVHRQLIKTKTR